MPASFTRTTSGGASPGSPSDAFFVAAAPRYPAKVTIKEDPPAPEWTLLGIDCQLDPLSTQSSFRVSSNQVVITLYQRETVTCIYTNALRPH